jgi:hypothetical protein
MIFDIFDDKCQPSRIARLWDRLTSYFTPAPVPPARLLPDGYYGPFILNPIGQHPMLAIALKATDEIDEIVADDTGLTESFRATDTCRGLYIEDEEGTIVSLIAWLPYEKSAWIGTAWTHADHREQGLYKVLFNRLRNEARDAGLTSVGCGVGGRNVASQEVHHEAFGMDIQLIQYTQAI